MAEKNSTVNLDGGRKLSVDEAHRYWKEPSDVGNFPEAYIARTESLTKRKISLTRVFMEHVSTCDTILELGCNAGRNLEALLNEGYRHLSAVEISPNAIELMSSAKPHVRKAAVISISSIEDYFSQHPLPTHDVIFTMAVLVHIAPESEWIFRRMSQSARKKIIIFEAEAGSGDSERHFYRRYQPIFEGRGWKQLEARAPLEGFPHSYICRVFGRGD